MNKYVDRLVNEWRQHGKIVIGVDFDDTIFPYRFSKDEIQNTIAILKTASQTGAYIVIHTACNTDRFSEIENYCEQIGLHIDGINITPIDVPFGKNGAKIYANIFIDDRAGIEESLDILESAMYKIRGEKATESTLKQAF